MYCNNCGKLVDDQSQYCSNCGAQIHRQDKTRKSSDNNDLAFGILGFFIPIAGLILYLVYEKDNPERAKCAGKGALIGVIVSVALSIISAVFSTIFSAIVLNSFCNIFASLF